MTIINNGLNRIRDLIYDDVDDGQFGTGGTASTAEDTDLETPIVTTIKTLTKNKSSQLINFEYELLSTEGTTATIKEFKMFNNANSENYDRIVFTGVTFVKNGTEDLQISKRYFIKSV